CSAGGRMVMVHSYAPRSVGISVDERVVESMRAAYAPERLESWPLRSPVDLIVDTPEGERLADVGLVERGRESVASAGFAVAFTAAYGLVPATFATLLARRHLGQTLCLELRRDLLVPEFTPFQEMSVDPEKVDRVAAALASAIRGVDG